MSLYKYPSGASCKPSGAAPLKKALERTLDLCDKPDVYVRVCVCVIIHDYDSVSQVITNVPHALVL